ncbi:RIMS-binding protein 2 isoform X8 [Periplaneta americana]|uniref:RIMS-binding protein 2 isoform X8 n=1 Tax=Periplaneta americana TaxID=6978 RepID=UPI0037E73206
MKRARCRRRRDLSSTAGVASQGSDLEDQLVRVLEKNTELTIQNTDLQKQVQHLQNVSAEGRSGLPGSVQPGSTSSANRSGDIESILKQMRDAADKRKELEQQHAEALTQLRDKQSELQRLTKFSTSTSSDKKSKSYETIEALQSKIRELEKKTELQNVRHEELLLEMASIKRSSQGSSASATMGPSTSSSTGWKLSRTSSTNQEVQTSPESGTSTPGFGLADSGRLENTGRSTPLDMLKDQHQLTGPSARTVLSRSHATTVTPGCGTSGVVLSPFPRSVFPPGLTSIGGYTPSYCMQQQPYYTPTPGPNPGLWKSPSVSDLTSIYQMSNSHYGVNNSTSNPPTINSSIRGGPLSSSSLPNTTTAPNQPPNSLPLLPNTCTVEPTVAASNTGTGTEMYAHSSSHAQSQTQQGRTGSPIGTMTGTSTGVSTVGVQSSSEIDRIMAKIEQDNRILAELDKTRSTIGLTGNVSTAPVGGVMGAPSTAVASGETIGFITSLPMLPAPPTGPATQLQFVQQAQFQPAQPTQYMMQTAAGLVPQGLVPQSTQLQHRLMPQLPATVPAILTTHYDLDTRNNFLNGNLPGVFTTFPADQLQQTGAAENKVDMLDVPGKGRCYVYIARYSYDPFQQSPNENPEAELAINAGDYLLVWGNMDEDGFFDGELLDGRRGLVPSNFIQKLVGDDLLEFHQAVVQGLRDGDDSGSTNIAHDLAQEALALMEDGYNKQRSLVPSDYSYIDLEDILEEDDEALGEQLGEGPAAVVFFSDLVPAPKQLTLERQLNKSVLIGWNPPDAQPGTIDSYHVYVDGVLKTTIKATERTRALVEGVDSTRPHRISVRSITPNRRTSRDAACTMVIGKDIPLGPSNVKASHVTSTSAVISWLPSNSNHQHVVCVNNVEVRTVKPGVYRHTITGLAPNTVYRVTVRAKNIRAPTFDEKASQQMERFSCHIDFRTLPKGLPDPPVDIQVEAGPQDGTLLVTWLPVGLNASTNGAPVTGYAVYADGKKVTDVDSPTGDHALIDINKLLGLNPKQVTVRTKSRDSQSADSVPTPIPSAALKSKMSKDGMDKMDRRQRERYGSAVPPHMRHHMQMSQSGHRNMRVDAHGQVIIDPEENLSDKEIYPAGNHINIPSIEITKDSASEGNFSEDDYLDGRRGARGHHGPGGGHYDPRGVPRSHAERGRPPPLPHERGRMDHHPTSARVRDRVDDRDQYYGDPRGDPRVRHGGHPGDRGYRGGPPPGRGPPPHHQPGPPPHPSGGPGPGPRDKRVRWFVALYDYNPTTMSPNPDACEEELPFSEGDTIKIYGDKDADGFYWGECRGRRGYVPHNMVVEVQDTPKEGGRGGPRDRWGDIYANMPVKKMIALYDYDPQELSPNVDAEVELSFQTGNIIYVYGDMDDDGFYMGELDGVRGLVPSNFLTEAPPDYSNGGGGPRQGRPPPQDRSGRGGGHGPGARGPPPPPRDGVRMDPRDRRKDHLPTQTQLDYRADHNTSLQVSTLVQMNLA